MRVIAGPEKKARLLSRRSARSRRTTRWATRSSATSSRTRTRHKITIVSRGQALGLTISLPTEDRYLTTRRAHGRPR